MFSLGLYYLFTALIIDKEQLILDGLYGRINQ